MCPWMTGSLCICLSLSVFQFLSLWCWFLSLRGACWSGAVRDSCPWEDVAPAPAHQKQRMRPVRQHLGTQQRYSQETLTPWERLGQITHEGKKKSYYGSMFFFFCFFPSLILKMKKIKTYGFRLGGGVLQLYHRHIVLSNLVRIKRLSVRVALTVAKQWPKKKKKSGIIGGSSIYLVMSEPGVCEPDNPAAVTASSKVSPQPNDSLPVSQARAHTG